MRAGESKTSTVATTVYEVSFVSGTFKKRRAPSKTTKSV